MGVPRNDLPMFNALLNQQPDMPRANDPVGLLSSSFHQRAVLIQSFAQVSIDNTLVIPSPKLIIFFFSNTGKNQVHMLV